MKQGYIMTEYKNDDVWCDDEEDEPETDEKSITIYDISASPNDFNIKTLYDFIDSKVVSIPVFQRNYVWDIKRASKLIESIVIGVPIPQIFLYETERNKFIVIDGQQRFMTIYYFIKKRFPREDKRFELRKIFDEKRSIPENILDDDDYFVKFNLQLSEKLTNKKNPLDNLNYSTFDDETKTSFDLRTIRNIIIKQNFPEEGDSVIYEIFNRLNSGGVNLKPQEVRSCLYNSDFYDMIYELNLNTEWRTLTTQPMPDLHLKDIEILLRGFAMLIEGVNYKPSLVRFINRFSKTAKKYPQQNIAYLKVLFLEFIKTCKPIGPDIFTLKTGRFNISVFESIFTACCEEAFTTKTLDVKSLDVERVRKLKSDNNFLKATQSHTSSTANVAERMKRAKEILFEEDSNADNN